MCGKILKNAVDPGVGYFRKGNEPSFMRMEVLVASCLCGERFYAKVPNGLVWVEAVKEEARNVDDTAVGELQADAAGAWAASNGGSGTLSPAPEGA